MALDSRRRRCSSGRPRSAATVRRPTAEGRPHAGARAAGLSRRSRTAGSAASALMVLALLGFTGIDTCAKWLVLTACRRPRSSSCATLVHLVLVVGCRAAVGERFLRTRNLGAVWPCAARSCSSAPLLNFAALGFLPLTMTSAIMFTGPLWVCLLSIPLLGERVGPRRWAAILVGFVGVLVVTRPWTGHAPLGGGAVARRGALRRALQRSSPACSPAATAPPPSSSTPASSPPSAWRRWRSPTGPGRRGAAELARLLRHRRLRLGRAPAPDHRPPLRAGLDAGALQPTRRSSR